MNPTQNPSLGEKSPFVSFGDSIIGVNIPQVLQGVNSPQELIELLAVANEIKQSGLNIKELKAKAEVSDSLQIQRDVLLKANEGLAGRVEELESILEGVEVEDTFIAPSFPEDFTFYGDLSGALDDEETQDLVVGAASVEIGEGEFYYTTVGNTAVIRMNDGEKIITVVAQDFYEALEDVGDGDGGCDLCS